jgi:serine protease
MTGRPARARGLTIATVAALAVVAGGAGAASAATPEVLVRFAPDATPAQRESAHAAAGLAGRVVDRIPALGVEVVWLPPGRSATEAAGRYERQPGVRGAGPNGELHALAFPDGTTPPNDPYFAPYQWNLRGIGAVAAWGRTQGARLDGTRAKVAIVDTGVAFENYGSRYKLAPDLADSTYVKFDALHDYDYVNNDSHANDDNGHGTHVAGTVAGSTNNGQGVAGLAFRVQVLPIKVLSSSGSGSYSAVAKGILRSAGYNVAGSGIEFAPADVVNLSLGGPKDTSGAVDAALQKAYDRGVTIVAAAGNEGGSSAGYPASADALDRPSGSSFTFNVIGVGAVGYFDATRPVYRAPYSNSGAGVDVYAPGGDTSKDLDGNGYGDGILQQTFSGNPSRFGYYFFQGTSMAAPHVAAVAALLRARDANLTPGQVAAKISATGTPTTLGAPLLSASAATAP